MRLNIVAREFWERQRSSFFMSEFAIGMQTPIALGLEFLDPDLMFRQHEKKEKKRKSARTLAVCEK